MSNNISIKLVPRLTPACVCMSNTTLQSIPPYSLGQLLGQLYGLVIESMDAKKNPSQNTRTQTEFNKEAKQVVVRHKLFLIVVKMYFKIPLQIKRGQYLFKKFDTETTLKHSCHNLCIMILKVYYQNKCSLKLSSLITIKLYMFLIPKTIYMLNS